MPKTNRNIETIITILVVFSALVGIYYMYAVSTGRAFLQAPTFTVRQTEIAFCCGQTEQGRLFEFYGNVEKGADEFTRAAECQRLIEEQYSTLAHPATLVGAGKCGEL